MLKLVDFSQRAQGIIQALLLFPYLGENLKPGKLEIKMRVDHILLTNREEKKGHPGILLYQTYHYINGIQKLAWCDFL